VFFEGCRTYMLGMPLNKALHLPVNSPALIASR